MKKGQIRFVILLGLVLGMLSTNGQNRWETLPNFPGSARSSNTAFSLDSDGDSIPDKGFIFGGWNLTTDYKDLWQFDPATGTWTQKADLPSYARRGPAAFTVGNIGYIACGAYATGVIGNFIKELWAYDIATNSWTQKSDFPSGPRWGMVGFSLLGYGYITMGDSGTVNNPYMANDLWQYSPANDTWVQKGVFPGSNRRMPSGVFTLDTDGDGKPDRAYTGGGQISPSTNANDFWEYNPANDHWTQKSNFPGPAHFCQSGFTIQNVGYVGLGADNGGVQNFKDLYRYDRANDTWLRMADMDGAARRDPNCFVIGDSAYIMGGYSGQVTNDVHRYIPFLNGYNKINGKLYVDANNNCTYDSGEEVLKNWLVSTVPGPYFANTDSNGNYSLLVDSGTYTVSQLSTGPQGLATVKCPISGSYQVGVNGYGIDTSGFDFGDSVSNCPFLTIDVNVASKHRCQDNLNVVHYCNDGFAIVRNVAIFVALPPYVAFVSADHPHTVNSSGYIVFHVDSIMPGVCDDIHIIDHIDCAHTEYIGLTACVKTWITPGNSCGIPNNNWNGADLQAAVTCSGGDTAQLTITNIGTGDMTDSTEYRVYVDQVLVFIGKVKLTAGSTFSMYTQTAGHTIRLEVDEPMNHPFNTTSAAWLEACGADVPMTVTQGFVTIFPTDEVQPEKATDCVEIDGAWDPNDKTVNPAGLTANHYVQPGTVLDYKIRFQNTGNAPANKVVLVDKLDPSLDPATLRITGASHAYTVDVSGLGSPTITFTFPNINLVDSGASQLLSQGFAAFSIKPYESTPLGTVINNHAGIYFDSNPAVLTNTTVTTISDYSDKNLNHSLEGNHLVEGLSEVSINELGISLFPNPSQGEFYLGFTQAISGKMEVSVTDLTGRVLWSKNISDIAPNIMAINLGNVSKGIYILNIRSNSMSVTKKIAVE